MDNAIRDAIKGDCEVVGKVAIENMLCHILMVEQKLQITNGRSFLRRCVRRIVLPLNQMSHVSLLR